MEKCLEILKENTDDGEMFGNANGKYVEWRNVLKYDGK